MTATQDRPTQDDATRGRYEPTQDDYRDYEQYLGSLPESEDSADCPNCDGSGECRSCLGYGHFDADGEPSIDGRDRKCLDCSGSGRCPRCGGKRSSEADRDEAARVAAWLERHQLAADFF